MRSIWKAAAVLLGSCLALPAQAAGWSTVDLKTAAPLPSATLMVGGVAVEWQVGNYWSDKLRIFGLLCKPASVFAPVPHPIAILNHGLAYGPIDIDPNGLVLQSAFTAIEANGFAGCVNLAASGWTVAISTYRGETIGRPDGLGGLPAPYANWSGTSDGKVELCYGEVDDVLNLLADLKALPAAIPHRVFMWGHSHGACITERAIERGAAVDIGVSIDGPTDFVTWTLGHAAAPTLPEQQARSSANPANLPDKLTKLKFLRVQAENDPIVPPEQACKLVKQIPGTNNYHLFAGTTPPGSYAAPPASCAPWPIPWKLSQLPPDEIPGGVWAAPTFLMYGAAPASPPFTPHQTILLTAWNEARSFVNQFAAPWGSSIPAGFLVLEN